MAFSSDLAVISQRERRCKSHAETREIPSDIVIEILTRLPARSLMRFKSVSKLWSSLICSLYFTNRFLKVSSSSPQLYLWLRVGVDNKPVLLSPSASPDSDGTTMASFVVDQDVTIPSMEGYSVSHVFRGLMCFTNRKSAQIYNTTTRQLVVLPDIEESNIMPRDRGFKKIKYQIGHDPVHDQYKVVCYTVSRRSDELGEFTTFLWVLPLGGGDGSSRWRKIPSRCPPHLPTKRRLTIINGRMYNLARVRVPHQDVIVSFDISSEEISMLQAPEDHASRLPLCIDLIECSGRVALLDHIGLENKGVMELWVMEDEEKTTWSRKTLVLHPSQMHMVNNVSLRVQGTTRKGEVIFVPQSRTRTRAGIFTNLFYVFLYNLENNHLRKVEIKQTSNRYLTDIWDVVGLGDVENFMHL